MFHRLSKHLEFRQNYSAARRIFNSLLGVRICRWNTVSRVWNTFTFHQIMRFDLCLHLCLWTLKFILSNLHGKLFLGFIQVIIYRFSFKKFTKDFNILDITLIQNFCPLKLGFILTTWHCRMIITLGYIMFWPSLLLKGDIIISKRNLNVDLCNILTKHTYAKFCR